MDSSSASRGDENQKAPSEADLAQAFLELSKGEKTAQALEANLTTLEKKLDDLLASFDESERQRVEAANGATSSATAKPAIAVKQGDKSRVEEELSVVADDAKQESKASN